MSVNDVLANTLADSLNKKFKDTNKVAYFLDGSDATPTDIKDFISTGSSMLDLAISNKPNGGIAVGRITEINGLESSGKSLLGAHILAETQKKENEQKQASAVLPLRRDGKDIPQNGNRPP